MNRAEFFKKLGVGVITIVTAPKIFSSIGKINTVDKFSKKIINMRPASTPLDTIIKQLNHPKEYMDARREAYRKYYEGIKWPDNDPIAD